jgi:hypothetical protein
VKGTTMASIVDIMGPSAATEPRVGDIARVVKMERRWMSFRTLASFHR